MAHLRRRWKDAGTAGALLRPIESFLASGGATAPLDLRGAEIGLDEPLAGFRLAGKAFREIDISFGKGALLVRDATVSKLTADRFAFDRASHLRRSELEGCSFVRADLCLSGEDVVFTDCDFSETSFRGGFAEFGFRRARFLRCAFGGATWRNAYLRACEFWNCDFKDAKFERCTLSGAKFFSLANWQTLLVDCDIKSLFVDDKQVRKG